jgi:ribose-phosphate pyrophosphokinase
MSVYLDGLPVNVEKFPNNETHIKDATLAGLEIEMRYEGDHDLMTLFFVRKQLGDRKVRLRMHYVPYSRMDRQIGEEVFTLRHVADFINSLDFYSVIIDEPHSDVTPALLNNVIVGSSVREMLPVVEKRIDFRKDVDYLVFPDAGAQKRYADLRGYKTLVGFKHRNTETGRIEKLEIVGDAKFTDHKFRQALILDDLCSYGGTFQLTAQRLNLLGFGYTGLIVAHCEQNIYKGDICKTNDVTINDVFTTDSILGPTSEHSKVHIYRYGAFQS